MNNCLNCNKEISQTEGKRARQFCSNSCRATFHQKKSAGKKKYVRIETYEALKKELEDFKIKSAKITKDENNKPTATIVLEEKPQTTSIDDAMKALYEATKAQIQLKNKK